MRIALISCSKCKKKYPCIAREMYSESTLFKYSYDYANINADKIYILSAKYGLLPDYKRIEPYDLTLKTMSTLHKTAWSNSVIEQLKNEFDLKNDEFIILAGFEYYSNLVKHLVNYKLPLGNLTFGERLSFLRNFLQNPIIVKKSEVPYEGDDNINAEENMCMQLHAMFNNSKIYDYRQIDSIHFENGIYILFEKGELYNGFNRIVRVGTHNAQGRFKFRLKDHFIRKNKDGSIFRKNVGKALLNLRNDNYLSVWNLNTSKPENRKYIIREVQESIEDEVTDYLQKNITFAVLRADDEYIRLRIEKAIIATLNCEKSFYPSKDWLGNYSTEQEIKESGLWLKIGLNHEIINDSELKYIKSNLIDKDSISFVNNIDLSKPTEHKNGKDISCKNSILGIKEIRKYITDILESQKSKGNHEYILISGDIHKQMGLLNKMPSVCSAMYNLMKANDEILKTTPSGKSSTITIKYYF